MSDWKKESEWEKGRESVFELVKKRVSEIECLRVREKLLEEWMSEEECIDQKESECLR